MTSEQRALIAEHRAELRRLRDESRRLRDEIRRLQQSSPVVRNEQGLVVATCVDCGEPAQLRWRPMKVARCWDCERAYVIAINKLSRDKRRLRKTEVGP